MRRAIMVCATKQHTGKTAVSMALLSNLRAHFARRGGTVGYMKPIGQQWVRVNEHRVDKDAALAHSFFALPDPIERVSPVVIGRGDTKAFLDDEAPRLRAPALAATLRGAFEAIAAAHDFVVVEGTGHCGVGAVLGWDNARVAAELGVDVVLVANGGVGSTVDELSLNVAVCRAAGARLAGIVVNKCSEAKVDEVRRYVQAASERAGWGAPVLACVPFGDGLDKPSVSDLVHLFEGGFSRERARSRARLDDNLGVGRQAVRGGELARAATSAYTTAVRYAAGYGGDFERARDDPLGDEPSARDGPSARFAAGAWRAAARGARPTPPAPVLLAGAEHMHRRFASYKLVSGSLERFMSFELMARGAAEAERGGSAGGGAVDGAAGGDCYVTHVSRADIIQGLLGHHALLSSKRPAPEAGSHFGGGLIIAGSSDEQAQPFIDELVRMASFPVLRSNLSMTETLAAIKDLRPKMQADDNERVRQVIELYSPHLQDATERLVEGR